MSISIVTGIPGSGKTTYAVWLALQHTDYYVMSNIDGFECDEVIPDDCISFLLSKKWEEETVRLNKKLLFIIDECQRYFSQSGMARHTQNEAFYFLEYHRHYGADVILITQSHYNLHKRVTVLAAEICQVSKIKNIKGEVRVKHLDPTCWEIIKTVSFKADDRIYSKFKSAANQFGLQKPISPFLRLIKTAGIYILVLLALVCLLIYLVYSKYFKNEVHTALTDGSNYSQVSQDLKQDLKQNTDIKPLVNKIQTPEIKVESIKLLSKGNIFNHDMTFFDYNGVSLSKDQIKRLGILVDDFGNNGVILTYKSKQYLLLLIPVIPEPEPESPPEPDPEPKKEVR